MVLLLNNENKSYDQPSTGGYYALLPKWTAKAMSLSRMLITDLHETAQSLVLFPYFFIFGLHNEMHYQLAF